MLAASLWGRAFLLFSLASVLFIGPAPLHAEASPEAASFWLDASALFEGTRAGLAVDEAGIVLGPDALVASRYLPHALFGVAESPAYSLGGPSSIGRLSVHAEVPPGAGLILEARGFRADQWSLWEPAEALAELDGASELQVRVTLLSAAAGESPRVFGVNGVVSPAVAAAPALAAPQFGPPTATLWATREGLVGQTTANGHVIVERDRFVALPSRQALNALGRRDYVVRLEYKGRVAEAPVWDIGPWNIRDDYWNQQRETSTDLPRWTPQAEAAFFSGYGGGRDRFGRYVTIPTSIDLADGTFWDDLKMTSNDWIKVTFLWLDAPSPPARATPLIIPKLAPRGESAAPVAAAPPPPAASSNSVLFASPNPAPAGRGTGASTVSWDIGDGTFGQVYVWQTGGGEQLFAQGISGSADASWIKNGWSYEFRLYQGTSRSKRLRTITVTGNSARVAAPVLAAPLVSPPVVVEPADSFPGVSEPPAAAGAGDSLTTSAEGQFPGSFMDLPWIAASPALLGGTTISWNAGGPRDGQVYVWQPGGGETLFAQGTNGAVDVPWLQNGWNYEFRLYQGLNKGERLQTVALNGNAMRAVRLPGGEITPGLAANLSSDGSGQTTIAWDTGSGEVGQIFWAEEDGAEELFAQSPIGMREVPRLAPGRAYRFRLYAGTDHTNLLAEVAAMGVAPADLMAESVPELADAGA